MPDWKEDNVFTTISALSLTNKVVAKVRTFLRYESRAGLKLSY